MSTVWSSCLAISKACSRTGKNLEKNSRCDCTERLTFQTGWDFSALKADRWRWIGWKSIHHDCGGETEFGMIAHELFRFKNWKHSVILTGNGCTVKKKKGSSSSFLRLRDFLQGVISKIDRTNYSKKKCYYIPNSTFNSDSPLPDNCWI